MRTREKRAKLNLRLNWDLFILHRGKATFRRQTRKARSVCGSSGKTYDSAHACNESQARKRRRLCVASLCSAVLYLQLARFYIACGRYNIRSSQRCVGNPEMSEPGVVKVLPSRRYKDY